METELLEWLAANRPSYEFYLLHKMTHSALFRNRAAVRLVYEDFSDEVHQLVFAAMQHACKLTEKLPRSVLPEKLGWSYLESYAKAVNAKEDIIDMDLAAGHIVSLSEALYALEPHNQHWHIVEPYLVTWLSDVRARRYAQQGLASQVMNTAELIDTLQRDRTTAKSLQSDQLSDEYHQALYGSGEELVERRSTGFPALDTCFNGGFGEGEAYLFFAGTGGGKTALCSQLAAYDIMHEGRTLIISTEVPPVKYMARILANLTSTDYGKLSKLRTLSQMIGFILSERPFVAELVDKIKDALMHRLRVYRVDGGDGLTGKQLIKLEIDRFVEEVGHMPKVVHFDWLGDVADQAGSTSSSERSAAWELAAASMVQSSIEHGIPHCIYAQAVNDAELKRILTNRDIGVGKGISKRMTVAVGITNTIDQKEVLAAMTEERDIPPPYMKEQMFCVTKSRDAEGLFVPVKRDFKYQRFISRNIKNK